MILIPTILLLFPSRLTWLHLIWGVLAAYTLSKILDVLDALVFRLPGISGHTLKDLAAAAVYLVLVAARARTRPSGERRQEQQ